MQQQIKDLQMREGMAHCTLKALEVPLWLQLEARGAGEDIWEGPEAIIVKSLKEMTMAWNKPWEQKAVSK